jgi:hypothetical protein
MNKTECLILEKSMLLSANDTNQLKTDLSQVIDDENDKVKLLHYDYKYQFILYK